MSWLPKRDKLDPVQASAIDFAVAQEGNFYFFLSLCYRTRVTVKVGPLFGSDWTAMVPW